MPREQKNAKCFILIQKTTSLKIQNIIIKMVIRIS